MTSQKRIFFLYISHIFLLVFYILSTNVGTTQSTTVSSLKVVFHQVTLSDSVLLYCGVESGAVKVWKYFDDILNVNKVVVHKMFMDTTSVQRNYSLYINHVLIFHEGIYTCFGELTIVITHILTVEGLYIRLVTAESLP